MTISTADLEVIRRDNAVTLAQLREMADVVGLLRSGSHVNPETGEPHGVRWELWSHGLADGGPLLVVGIRGNRGTLNWFATGGQTEFVPEGTLADGPSVEYWRGGQPEGSSTDQEVPVEYVYAAIGEFVATGDRPRIIRWTEAEEIARPRSGRSLEDDPVFQAWQDAAGSGGNPKFNDC
ncbi:Imm1 family immunity protein [Amycolatopsis sp. NPDC051716]|uniref:Imm1 family immunity protein n=1 Tax=Amycolatopsis sp. NPDC051716 TaxID=3155804 RepID=UPI003412169F